MNRFFPIRSNVSYAIRLKDGDLFTYDDGKIAIGDRSYLELLMKNVLRDFSEAEIIEIKPDKIRAKKKV
jgi:hypothetical protein